MLATVIGPSDSLLSHARDRLADTQGARTSIQTDRLLNLSSHLGLSLMPCACTQAKLLAETNYWLALSDNTY